MSKTTRPVTHVALVDVNKASKNPVHCPDLLAIGKHNNSEPIRITAKKPSANIYMYPNFIFFFDFIYAFIITLCIISQICNFDK